MNKDSKNTETEQCTIPSVRHRAMKWWNDFGSASKTYICDTNTELLGSVRRWETLTGREIEILYSRMHGA